MPMLPRLLRTQRVVQTTMRAAFNLRSLRAVGLTLGLFAVLASLGTPTSYGQSGTRALPPARPVELGGKNQVLQKFQVDDRSVREIIDLLSESSGLNIVATPEAAQQRVTLTLRNIRVIDAIEIMAKISGLWYREEEETGTIRLLTVEQYQDDLIVFRDDITRVFTLLHPNAISIAQTIQNLYGQRVVLSLQAIDDDALIGTTGIIGGVGGGIGGGGGFGNAGGIGGGFGGGGFGGAGGIGGGFGGGGFGGAGGIGGRFGGGGLGGFGGGGFGGGGFGGGLGGFGGGGLGGFGGGGRFGGGGGGFGGRQGFGGVGGAFSRGGGLSQNPFLLNTPFGNNLQATENAITAAQAARLQQLAQTGDSGQQGVDSEDLRNVTSREPLIFVALNRTHSLVIVRTSDRDAMKAIERLILELDRPTPEVLLEMKILQVTLTDNFRSILDLQYNAGPAGPTAADQLAANPFVNAAAGASQNVLGFVDSPELTGIGGDSSFLYQFLNDNLRARLEFLQENSLITSLASPVLLSSNNRPARIFVGEERVLVTGINSGVVTPATGATTSVVQPQTEVRDIGTSLVVLPKINADRSVTLSIAQDQSEVQEDAQQLPVSDGTQVTEFPIDSVTSSNIQGTVVAHDGLTIAVGGLITDSTTVTERHVPGLSKLPIVGKLFRQHIDENIKTELILLVTPHVITTPIEGQYKTQARLRALSDHPSVTHHEFHMTEPMVPSFGGQLPDTHIIPSHELDESQSSPWRDGSMGGGWNPAHQHVTSPHQAHDSGQLQEISVQPESHLSDVTIENTLGETH